jgi:hypothetical protein
VSTTPERSLRFVDAGKQQTATQRHWQTCSTSERLHAVLALHREGNALFKGGNPSFVFQWELRHVHLR